MRDDGRRDEPGRYRVVERDGYKVVQQWRRRGTKYDWVDVYERKSEPSPPPGKNGD